MAKQALQQIKKLCTGEIKFCGYDKNVITILVPYSQDKLTVDIEGATVEDQIESFISEVNRILEDMIDHLGDVKLSNVY